MNTTDVHVFVFDTLSDWEIGHAIAGINNPQFQKNPGRYRIRTVAQTLDTVVTIGGLRIEPDMTLDDLSPSDSALLILPGGQAWDEGHNQQAVEAARRFLAAGTPIAAICGATSGLARGGLLDQRHHTSNARDYLAATQYRGSALYQDQPAVTDDNLVTASAMMPIDFAYHIFALLDVYSTPVLDAWFRLFKSGRPDCFNDLLAAANA